MRRNLSPLAPLLALALAGACNTPGPVADDDDEPGMVDLGPIDDITPETLAMTSSNKPKCPANSKDPGCIKGRNIVSIFRGLDRNVLGARCDQTPGGQTTAVAFDILDPQAVLNQQF